MKNNEKLIAIRELIGISTTEVAHELGHTYSYLWRKENGSVPTNNAMIFAYAYIVITNSNHKMDKLKKIMKIIKK